MSYAGQEDRAKAGAERKAVRRTKVKPDVRKRGEHPLIFHRFIETAFLLLGTLSSHMPQFQHGYHADTLSPILQSHDRACPITTVHGPAHRVFPDGKESVCNTGDPGSVPELGRSPGERTGYLLQYSRL